MAWVRIDDGYADHPKFEAVGPLGLAVNTRALCYCSRQLTDGKIPYSVAQRMAADAGGKKTIQALVDAELWEDKDGAYWLHDYLDYNPSKAEKDKKRRATLKRVRRHREQSNGLETPTVTPLQEALPSRARDPQPQPQPPKIEEANASLSPQAPTDPIPELEQQVIAGVNDALSLSGAAKLKASRHLRQRLRDGATVQECLDVYLWAADTWGKVRGTPSAQYVRPSTLYGKEKFPGYARSAQQWRGGGDTPKSTPTKRRHVRDRRPEITDEEIATLHASGYCDAEGYQ